VACLYRPPAIINNTEIRTQGHFRGGQPLWGNCERLPKEHKSFAKTLEVKA
jgi:hypothetical protein